MILLALLSFLVLAIVLAVMAARGRRVRFAPPPLSSDPELRELVLITALSSALSSEQWWDDRARRMPRREPWRGHDEPHASAEDVDTALTRMRQWRSGRVLSPADSVVSAAAWGLSERAQEAVDEYRAGRVSRPEMVARLRELRDAAERHFAGWAEFGRSWVLGALLAIAAANGLSRAQRERAMSRALDVCCAAVAPAGPWATAPWSAG